MKKKILNIKPQEVNEGGERMVRYKGGDGKMHTLLPQGAAVPKTKQIVLEAGRTITLAQANKIKSFDFNKCSKLDFSSLNIYSDFCVNNDGSENWLLYSCYPGTLLFYTKTNGDEFETFHETSEATQHGGYDRDVSVTIGELKETLFNIAKKTGKLTILRKVNSEWKQSDDEPIELTLDEEVIAEEEYYIEKSTGEVVNIGLPKNAAVPVAQRTIIEHGTEITLAQAHEIEDFDFDNCTALRLNESFEPEESFMVNLEDNADADSQRVLEYTYTDKAVIRFYKSGQYYSFFPSSETPATHEFEDDEQGAKAMLEEKLLEIAKEKSKLEIYGIEDESIVRLYEDSILLTVKKDILLSEEFFMESFSGELLKLPVVAESDKQEESEETEEAPAGAMVIEARIGNNNEGTTEISSDDAWSALVNDNRLLIYKLTLTGGGMKIIVGGMYKYDMASKDGGMYRKITIPTAGGSTIGLGDTIIHHHNTVTIGNAG